MSFLWDGIWKQRCVYLDQLKTPELFKTIWRKEEPEIPWSEFGFKSTNNKEDQPLWDQIQEN